MMDDIEKRGFNRQGLWTYHYRKSFKQGNERAFSYGRMFYIGQGIGVDVKVAVKWTNPFCLAKAQFRKSFSFWRTGRSIFGLTKAYRNILRLYR